MKNITKKQTRGKEPVDSGAAYFALGVLSPLRACESCNRRAAVVYAYLASSTFYTALTLGNASVGLGDLTTDSGCQLLKR